MPALSPSGDGHGNDEVVLLYLLPAYDMSLYTASCVVAHNYEHYESAAGRRRIRTDLGPATVTLWGAQQSV